MFQIPLDREYSNRCSFIISSLFKLLLLFLQIMPSTHGKTESGRLCGEFLFPQLQPLVSQLPQQPLPEMQTQTLAHTAPYHTDWWWSTRESSTPSVRPQGPALTVERLAQATSSLSTVAPFCFSSSDVILCGFPEPARAVLSKDLQSRC